MLKILADFHHRDLHESFRMLFEDRLRWYIAKTVGMEWYNVGLSKLTDDPRTAMCLLSHNVVSPNKLDRGTRDDLSNYGGSDAFEQQFLGHGRHDVLIEVKHHGRRSYHGVRLSQAVDHHWDVILCTFPEHLEAWKRLRDMYWPKAKIVFAVGNNAWDRFYPQADNILSSVAHLPPPADKPYCFHRPEFDLDEYKFEIVPPEKRRSLVCFINQYKHFKFWDYWESTTNLLKASGWDVKLYGIDNPDGICTDVAKAMREAGFVWHAKEGQFEGYGFIIHQAAACGKPIITSLKEYGCGTERPYTAAPLLGVAEDVDDMGPIDMWNTLEQLAKCGYEDHCELTYGAFKSVVDFAADAERVRKFFEEEIR